MTYCTATATTLTNCSSMCSHQCAYDPTLLLFCCYPDTCYQSSTYLMDCSRKCYTSCYFNGYFSQFCCLDQNDSMAWWEVLIIVCACALALLVVLWWCGAFQKCFESIVYYFKTKYVKINKNFIPNNVNIVHIPTYEKPIASQLAQPVEYKVELNEKAQDIFGYGWILEGDGSAFAIKTAEIYSIINWYYLQISIGYPILRYTDEKHFMAMVGTVGQPDIPGLEKQMIEGGREVTMIHRGRYSEMQKTYDKIREEILDKGYEERAKPYEIYLNSLYDAYEEGLLTKICFPIK